MFFFFEPGTEQQSNSEYKQGGEKREKNNIKWVAYLSITSHITQLSTLWGHVTARTADWGQSGWPELLQSVISMFDQPDYRDLTDRMLVVVVVGMGGWCRKGEA